jgi:FkbM family methyltransferase
MPVEELEVFKSLKDIKVVFDVGARMDTDYIKARPDIEIHYFEPNPEFAKELYGGKVNILGLSDREERLPYHRDTQSFVSKGWKMGVFNLSTLDIYAKNIPKIDFIKIDCEGMDYKILVGGTETLKKTRYVQFEYWDGVQKFVDLLKDFDLFLIRDARLYNDVIKPRVTGKKWEKLLVPLTKDVIELIDKTCIPLGAGGNILGIRK